MKLGLLAPSVLVLDALITFVLPAQSLDSALAFYPMHQGNKWVYYFRKIQVTEYYSSVEIRGDTVMSNGRRFSIFLQTNLSDKSIARFYQRIDSSTACIYEWDSTRVKERGVDSLRGNPPTIYFTEGVPRYPHFMISEKILGVPTTTKYFSSLTFIPICTYAYGFGLVQKFVDDRFWGEYTDLVYARINGVEYGAPVSVSSVITSPTGFVLSENYPNPFNPATTISYQLKAAGAVSLKVFDALGREIAVLVNETQPAGKYTVTWDGAGFPSGLYFCRLQTKGVVDTKKMILLK